MLEAPRSLVQSREAPPRPTPKAARPLTLLIGCAAVSWLAVGWPGPRTARTHGAEPARAATQASAMPTASADEAARLAPHALAQGAESTAATIAAPSRWVDEPEGEPAAPQPLENVPDLMASAVGEGALAQRDRERASASIDPDAIAAALVELIEPPVEAAPAPEPFNPQVEESELLGGTYAAEPATVD